MQSGVLPLAANDIYIFVFSHDLNCYIIDSQCHCRQSYLYYAFINGGGCGTDRSLELLPVDSGPTSPRAPSLSLGTETCTMRWSGVAVDMREEEVDAAVARVQYPPLLSVQAWASFRMQQSDSARMDILVGRLCIHAHMQLALHCTARRREKRTAASAA